jgi:hypothetical protein
MASILTIDSITSVASPDGNLASVVVDGTATGSVSFYANRTPTISTAFSVPFTGSGPYYVTFPHAGGWYLWVCDGNGFCVNPGAQWLGQNAGIVHQDMVEIGEYLRDTFRSNAPLLDAAINNWFPNAKVEQIEFGFPGGIVKFPSILVMKPSVEEEWAFMPYGKIHDYRFEIMFLIAHGDEQSMLQYVEEFARAGQAIINYPGNETINLPSGLQLKFCQADTGEGTNVDLGDAGFSAVGSLIWTGQGLKMDVGN